VTYPSAEGGYLPEIPALKGCLAQGETLSETLEELAIVEALWIETARKNGIKLPGAEKEIKRVSELLAA
jgi:predicted RNase H-like HicB family nuclease